LRASHIKPWSASNNVERLDPYNGLLLSVGYDVAFDSLLITFDENGEIAFAPDFSIEDAKAVGINAHARLRHVHPFHILKSIAPAFKEELINSNTTAPRHRQAPQASEQLMRASYQERST
jgi:HNH endonuclease